MNDEQLIWEAYKTLNESSNDYQYGDCMFFSEELKNTLKNLLPNHVLKYEMILGYREYEDRDKEDVLVHVYINIDNKYYLDSNGINSQSNIDERMDEWFEVQESNLNDYIRKYDSEYSFNCYPETGDHIPENLIPETCNTIQLKKDINDYLNREDIKDLIAGLNSK